MMKLMDIKDTITQVVNAISESFNIEVVVSDLNCSIVAGSEGYINKKGDFLNKRYVTSVLKAKKIIIVKNPIEHSLCDGCTEKDRCPIEILIDCPIFLKDEIIGLITLTGVSKAQKDFILEREVQLIKFLENMARLISGTYCAKINTEIVNYINGELNAVIDNVTEGIIAIDNKGIIITYNKFAQNILGMQPHEVIGKHIKEINEESILFKAITRKEEYFNKEEIFRYKDKNTFVISNVNLIFTDQGIKGAVEVFRHIKDIKKMAIEVLDRKINYNTFDDILGSSRPISNVIKKAKEVSINNSSVLITGESGTGKEMLARAIHYNSKRYNKPFIAVNCGAVPENLIESEFFGYEEGAFSGAKRGGNVGWFEQANGGTLFLDEIGDMPLCMQVKILRVLQENYIVKIGSRKQISIDVRVISATNKSLEKLIKKDKFREDLYYRINVIPLYMPSLRKRKEDINLIAEKLLKDYSLLMNKHITGFANEVINILNDYPWHGNIRELKNVIEYAVNMETGGIIRSSSLPLRIRNIDHQPLKFSKSFQEKVHDFEKKLIIEAVDRYENSVEGKKKAAKELGISIASLYRKLDKYNITYSSRK